MVRWIARFAILLLVVRPLAAQDGALGAPTSADLAVRLDAAVLRALPPLQESGDDWYLARTCNSCHHASLGLIAVAAARERGLAVDDDLAARLLARVLRTSPEAEAGIVQGDRRDVGINAQIGQGYRLLALAASDVAPNTNTDAVVTFLAGKQQPDGHWRSESHRPPLEDSEFTATALSLRALRRYVTPALADEIAGRVRRARDWLVTAVPVTHEERVMQLFGLAWSDAGAEEIDAAVAGLRATQRPDGGWAQIARRESDAFATAEALVALHEAGGVSSADETLRRGAAFLLDTQLADGTWHVTTRRKTEGLPYFESGFPHGEDQFVSAAATGWAIAALCALRDDVRSPIWTGSAAKARPAAVARADPQAGAASGSGSLLAAALSGSVDDLADRLASGADANARGPGGLTPLLCAASDVDKVRLLLAHGADPSTRSELGQTVFLAAAARDGGLPVLRLLLARGPAASQDDLDEALRAAALAGDLAKIDLLSDAGASLEAPGEEGETALMLATWQGDAELVRQLVARGAEVDPVGYGVTPLLVAAEDGQRDALVALLESGADVAARDGGPDGPTALHWAAIIDPGTTALVEALLAHGAPLDARDEDGRTPLDRALEHGNTAFAEVLRAAAAGR
ncbi:MAG: ankyrin repeat domain-containing protein [Planctomycetes bacterium]|nr:ankyrin repeat domain-containing protein [Planctomycetota bacterium]